MIRTSALAALLLTAGCGQQQQPAPPANDVVAAPAAPKAKAEIPALKGSWTVTGGSGLTATFADNRLVLSEGCLRRAWTFTQKGNSVAFTSSPGAAAIAARHRAARSNPPSARSATRTSPCSAPMAARSRSPASAGRSSSRGASVGRGGGGRATR